MIASLLAAVLTQDPATLEGDALLRAPVQGDFTVVATAPRVDVLVFPDLPQDRQTLWSSWGDGCLASNGRYCTAIGDHRGRDATSRVYEYDPAAKKLRLIVDVAKAIGQKPGAYGHGKIHAGLHEFQGALWFATYWGKPRELEDAFAGGYEGSVLLRWDLKEERIENLGAIAPRRGLPASHLDPARGLLYFHAVAKGGEDEGELLVYDLAQRRVRFQGGGDVMEGRRAFLRDLAGRLHFSAKDGTLAHYDPEKNAIVTTKAKLPEAAPARRGSGLRAGAAPTKSGLLHGMTAAGRLFCFDPQAGSAKDLGPNFAEGDYTAVLVLSPDEKFLYFAPGAHGSSVRSGTPIVQVEIATGARKALCFLNPVLRERLKYNIGGAYNVQIDGTGERLFLTFNGAPLAGDRKQEAFGQPCIAVVHIPPSER